MVNPREVELSSGKVVFLGKDSSNNDELVSAAGPKDVLLHTAAPGSPFCNCGEKPSKKEINEAAIYVAMRSQIWRDTKKDVMVHVFLGKDVWKDKLMKSGTWGVKKFKEIRVKKGEILRLT